MPGENNMQLTPAVELSADIIAKLSNALENFEEIAPDDMIVMLSEALDVINELVALADSKSDS